MTNTLIALAGIALGACWAFVATCIILLLVIT